MLVTWHLQDEVEVLEVKEEEKEMEKMRKKKKGRWCWKKMKRIIIGTKNKGKKNESRS